MNINVLKTLLKQINAQGSIKTHRKGPTGIGKTLEDLLKIKENNILGPDIDKKIELKSSRIDSVSMLTLFTKNPFPRGANKILLTKYGYKSKRKIRLETTINAKHFNSLRGKKGLKLSFDKNNIYIINSNRNKTGAYWTSAILKQYFEIKYHDLLLVKAQTRIVKNNEYFHYKKAYLLKEFSFRKFKGLLKKGSIVADIRIGAYSTGKSHDHGTAFRIQESKLDQCFSKSTTLL